MRKVTDIFRKKLVVFALIIASVFAGVASPIAVSTANVEEAKATELFPVDFRTLLGSDMGWIEEKDPSILNNLEIKLYKLDIERYREIIDENGGGFFLSTRGRIYNQAISEAQLVDKWSLSESNHITNLSGGDYFLSAHDSLYGLNEPYPYFTITDDGKEMYSYEIEGSKDDDITSTTIYKEGSVGTSREIKVNITDDDLLVKYIDPRINIYDNSGNNITDKCEIAFYKKDNMELNLTTGTDVSIFNGIDGISKSAALEHPGTHIIRCVNVPPGYKKFDDVTLEIRNQKYVDDGSDMGWPIIEIDDKCKSYAKWALEPNIWFYHIDPAIINITLEDAVMADSVQLNKSTLTLDGGKYEYLTATVLPEDTYDKTVTWSSSDESVAKVDKNTGKVTAVKAGTAAITAETVNGKTAACKVTVKSSAIETITINKTEIELARGKSETLTATVLPADAEDKTVTWSSSDTNVATVDKNTGKVTAKNAGMATITAKTVNGKTATCSIEVVRKFVPKIDGNSFVHTNNDSEFMGFKNAGFAGRENRQFFVGKQKTDYNDYHNRLKEVITKTDNLRNTLENMYKEWGGSCFGISAVMGLKYRNKIDSECIADNTDTMFFDADWPCKNIKMDNYINFYQLLQYEFLSHPELSKHIATWWLELDSINPWDNCYATGDFLIEVVNSIKSGKTLLLNTDSHTVLLPGTYEEDENSYQIDLFDCNTVNDNNTIGTMSKFIINKDYKDFSIELDSGVITDDNHGSLSIIDIDDLPILNIDNNTVDNVKWTYDDLYQLHINISNEFTFINEKGELKSDGNTIKGNLKVYYISPSGYCDSLNNTPTENKYYTLKIDQSSEYIITDIEKNIDISIGDAENSYSIKGSGIEEIRITPNEGLTIKGDVMSYKVMLNTKDKINENEKGIIEIEGKGKKEVKFTQQKETILIDSEEDCENVSITSYLTFEPYVQFENRKGNHFVANSGTEPGSKYVQVKEVTIPEQKIELGINESYLLQPNIEPDNSTNKKIKYISSSDNIVTVDKDGNIKAVGEGEAVIQIISEDSGVKTECSVVVKKGNKNIQKTDNKKSNEVTENQVSKPSAASNGSSVKKVVSSSGIAKKAGTSAGVVTQASKTGDNNLTALWITLSAVSAGIAGAIIALIKRRRTE